MLIDDGLGQEAEAPGEVDRAAGDGRRLPLVGLLAAGQHLAGHHGGAGGCAAHHRAFLIPTLDDIEGPGPEQGGRQAVLIATQKPVAGEGLEQLRGRLRLGFLAVDVDEVGVGVEFPQVGHHLPGFLVELGAGHREQGDAGLAGAPGQADEALLDRHRGVSAPHADEVAGPGGRHGGLARPAAGLGQTDGERDEDEQAAEERGRHGAAAGGFGSMVGGRPGGGSARGVRRRGRTIARTRLRENSGSA